MHHIQYCLDEILAEIDARLEQHSLFRALAQLDQREAESDPVMAIDSDGLRAQILDRIDALPLKQARNKIMQVKGLAAVAFGPLEPLPAGSNVVLLTPDAGFARVDGAKTSVSAAERPVTRPAPQFKSMQERLAAAVGDGGQRHAQPKRA